MGGEGWQRSPQCGIGGYEFHRPVLLLPEDFPQHGDKNSHHAGAPRAMQTHCLSLGLSLSLLAFHTNGRMRGDSECPAKWREADCRNYRLDWVINHRTYRRRGPDCTCDRLVGLVVRRTPRGRKVPGSNPACAGIFSGSSHTSDLNIGTPVATLPGAWRYRVSAGTGRPVVSIL